MSGSPLLHIVLVEPEIPPNTGSVARLCAANGLRLHLVEPLGFTIDDKHLKRAGLDYWPFVDVERHPGWGDFDAACDRVRRLYYSARAARSYLEARHRPGDWLIFGGESRGLRADVVAANQTSTFCIPMRTLNVRSLNLSNAVSVVVYEALRQLSMVAPLA